MDGVLFETLYSTLASVPTALMKAFNRELGGLLMDRRQGSNSTWGLLSSIWPRLAVLSKHHIHAGVRLLYGGQRVEPHRGGSVLANGDRMRAAHGRQLARQHLYLLVVLAL